MIGCKGFSMVKLPAPLARTPISSHNASPVKTPTPKSSVTVKRAVRHRDRGIGDGGACLQDLIAVAGEREREIVNARGESTAVVQDPGIVKRRALGRHWMEAHEQRDPNPSYGTNTHEPCIRFTNASLHRSFFPNSAPAFWAPVTKNAIRI